VQDVPCQKEKTTRKQKGDSEWGDIVGFVGGPAMPGSEDQIRPLADNFEFVFRVWGGFLAD